MPRTKRASKKRKNDDTKVEEVGEVVLEQPPVKKQRGRPKKDKTTDKSDNTSDSNKTDTTETTTPASAAVPPSSPSFPAFSSEAQQAHDSRALEKGHIFFFYRPKIELEDASSLDEVQKLYMVLRPEASFGDISAERMNRLIVLTKKRLPNISAKERTWGFVDSVSYDMKDITKLLGPTTYEAKTQGTRHLHGAMPCGSGVYGIVHHSSSSSGQHQSKDHTHIAYVLELPEEPGEMQKAFNIVREGSYIISVKNPRASNPPEAGLAGNEKVEYPKGLQGEFHGKKWLPVDDVKLINFDKAELLLIGAAQEEAVKAELGKPISDIERTAAEEEEEEHDHPECMLDSSLFKNLAKEKMPEQIITGDWHTQQSK